MPPDGKLPDNEIEALTAWDKSRCVDSRRFRTGTPGTRPHESGDARHRGNKKLLGIPACCESKCTPSKKLKHGPLPRSTISFLTSLNQPRYLRHRRPPNSSSFDARITTSPAYRPTIDDITSFVNDKSDRAFEKVIDRLLDSPQYGERWGRHWLDLVRFAESNSYERDGTKPFIWRYRDYVIKSFNEDKPYTQFIREQIAGDEFEPPTPDSIVATGYYRLGIWDDEPVSQKQALYDDLDDILLTTSQVFLGLTMNCARCHDHKIDPIPQKDYYSFLAFFSGFKRYGVRGHDSVKNNSIGPIAVNQDDRKRNDSRQAMDRELGEQDRKINQVNRRLNELMTPPEKEDFKAVEVRVDIARKYSGKGLSKKLVSEYATAVQRRKEILDTRPPEVAQALIIKEVGKTPRDTFILVRGNANVEGAEVEPAFSIGTLATGASH